MPLTTRWKWALPVIGVLLIASLATASMNARPPVAPPISPETVIGVWEGVVVAEVPRLYILEVERIEPSEATLTIISGPGVPSSMVFRATRVIVDNNGQLSVDAQGEGVDKESFVELRSRGTAFAKNGRILASVTVGNRSDRASPKPRPVVFVKMEEGFFEWICGARNRAREIVKAGKMRRATPVPGGDGSRR